MRILAPYTITCCNKVPTPPFGWTPIRFRYDKYMFYKELDPEEVTIHALSQEYAMYDPETERVWDVIYDKPTIPNYEHKEIRQDEWEHGKFKSLHTIDEAVLRAPRRRVLTTR